jgi:NitT/TauT family transport system ATP-binding protein
VKKVTITVKGLTKGFDNLIVLKDLNIDFTTNGIHCIFGPSGCGKTTLVNIITGLIDADEGIVEGNGHHTFSYIFQEDRLLPWASVEDNIKLVLDSYMEKGKAKELTSHYLSLVNLIEFSKSYPSQLSGGMKQRVSIARAFVYDGDIFIMDEPFKGIDFETKKVLMDYVINYCKGKDKILLFITHDVDEALYMADMVHIFKGPPLTIRKQIKIDVTQCLRGESQLMMELKKEILTS